MDGSALRIGAADFDRAVERSPALRLLAMRYCKALWVQCAYTALANSITRLEARLARWLLMVHDRIDGDRFELTHDFMAVMLAVRRPGVTVALHELEGKALIRSTRGTVTIRDREGLIEMADGAYTLPEREYERLLGIPLMRESR
jgi:CRP-like cAMP-binding protein